MAKKKILLVDDSETYRDMARQMLESRGYEVVALSSPFAFGAAMTRERPDLALVDAFMPALQGDQLVRLARQNNLHDCPIVLHSERSPRDLLQMVETSGATGFLPKTSDPEKLARAIEEFLKQAPARGRASKPPPAPIEPLTAGRPGVPPESRRAPSDQHRLPPESHRPPPDSRPASPDSRRSRRG